MSVRIDRELARRLGLSIEEPERKYKNRPTVYEGVRYASIAEAAYAWQLDLLKAAGDVRLWLGQPRFRLGCAENVYVADFLVVWVPLPERSGDDVVAIDVKGCETHKFKHDKKLWAEYGPCPLYVVRGNRVVERVLGGGDPGRRAPPSQRA